ncbi:MAG: preprotein translocase subunit SecG, partial [Phycisphaerales bacterium]|nr:preprotein translocase subunit SecG [Phycisphaerales bacterium]
MTTFLFVIFTLISLLMILVVLVQRGRGGGL